MKTLYIIFILAFGSLSAAAQNGAGSIGGTVTDAAGTPLGSSTVTLRRASDSAQVKVAVAGTSGDYRFEAITAGKYLVQGSAVGHTSGWTASLQLEPGQALTVSALRL